MVNHPYAIVISILVVMLAIILKMRLYLFAACMIAGGAIVTIVRSRKEEDTIASQKSIGRCMTSSTEKKNTTTKNTLKSALPKTSSVDNLSPLKHDEKWRP